MSTFHITVTVQHEGKIVPGFPLIRNKEDTTLEAKLIDNMYRTNDLQAPYALGSATAPMVALVFEKGALVQLGSEIGNTFRMGPKSCVLAQAAISISFETNNVDTHVQGSA